MSKSCFVAFVVSLASGLASLGGQVEFPQTIPACPAEYLTDSLLASDGSIWVTSEGKGIFRYYPGKESKDAAAWMDASYFRGLPDTVNYYALAEDKQGRIWAGTDNKGVAVFNGETWKTYDRENALLGERVFDIAVSPKTGDVAVATSGGISIFQPGKGDWVSLTRAEGLEEDQVETLAYDRKGNLWLGYACGGVSQLSEKENYRVVKTDQAKWYWDKENRVRQPMDGTGKGLPSNLCNALLPTKNGTILVGTNSGLALKKDKSEWRYFRGKDYRDKNKGLWNIPEDVAAASKVSPLLLPEDYITCLAETNEGYWIGFRQKGAVLLNPASLNIIKEGKFLGNTKIPFVRSLLSLPDGSIYSATYGHSLIKIHDAKGRKQMRTVDGRKENPSHPAIPRVKSLDELEHGLAKCEQQVSSELEKDEKQQAVFWKEDWATKGDWCERYGSIYALLCGTHGSWDDVISFFDPNTTAAGRVGGHRNGEERLSIMTYGKDFADDGNVVFNPETGTRVASEWSDNGEKYSSCFDGPDIWVPVHVSEGVHEISLYFYNMGGQDLEGKAFRDYVVEVRRYVSKFPLEITYDLGYISDYHGGKPGDLEKETKEIAKAPVLSRTRIKNFAGSGVYKTFLVSGEGDYYFRVINNYSSDATLNGVFVTKKKEDGKPRKVEASSSYAGIYPQQVSITQNDKSRYEKEIKLWDKGMGISLSAAQLSSSNQRKLDLYRKVILEEGGKNSSLAKNWRWNLKLWDTDERKTFEEIMCESWYANQDKRPVCRSQQFFPFSPRTIPFTAKECRIMIYMGIDWKDYLPEAEKKPEISAIELKERISNMSNEDIEILMREYYSIEQNEK